MKNLAMWSIALLFASCSYSERKVPEETAQVAGAVGFASVKSIFQNKCGTCHGSWAGNYDLTVAKMPDIADRIQSTDPNRMMPKPGAPPLTPMEKALILQWIAQGGPNEPGVAPALPIPSEPPPPLPVDPEAPLNFARVFVQVLQPKCLRCHETNFDSYEHTRPLIGGIRFRVQSTDPFEQMPPPRAKQLTEEEKELLLEWIRLGAPEE